MPSIPRSPAIAAAAVGVLAGYAVSSWLAAAPADRARQSPVTRDAKTTAEPAAVETEIALLRAALEEERGRIAALEFEVEMLRSVLETRSTATGEVAATGDDEPREKADLAHSPGAQPDRDWFDQESLSGRGIDTNRAAWLNEQFEELQMAELYLRDEATREGWLGTRRHNDELRELRAATRETLSDEDYDLLLYAAGRHNRVVVKDLLKTSPAAIAGIEAGDIVERYGDQKIFTARELIDATSRGDRRGHVPVDVWREGRSYRVYVPSGPLGMRIVPGRHFPAEAAW